MYLTKHSQNIFRISKGQQVTKIILPLHKKTFIKEYVTPKNIDKYNFQNIMKNRYHYKKVYHKNN